MKLFGTILTAITLVASTQTFAEPMRLEVDLREREFNSAQGEDTVYLKALLQREYGNRIDLRNAELERVVVGAKSQHGRATMSLVVDRDQSRLETIQGHPSEYDRPGIGYGRYVFMNPSRDSRGEWQLHLKGNVKIDRIVVTIDDRYNDPRPDPRPGRRTRIGDVGNNNPFGGWDTDSVTNNRPGRYRGVEFHLARGVGIEFDSVEITCQNGRVCYSQRLNAVVDERRPIRLGFRYDLNVRTVTVRIRSTGVSIPPPKVDVYLVD